MMGATTRKRQYRNAPIEEALVEIHFVPGQEWDLTIPGKLHQHPKIKNQYPGKPRNQEYVEVALHGDSGQPQKMAVREGIHRIQLVDEGGHNLIAIGKDLISVNVLRPYDGWEQLRPRIVTALEAYSDVAEPTAVSRVGLRYINRIVFKEHPIKVSTYFQWSRISAPNLPKKMGGFTYRVEFVYEDGVKFLLTHATVDAPEGQSAFLLDLDLIWTSSQSKSLKEIMAVVDDLHEREGAAFEEVITDATREVFDVD